MIPIEFQERVVMSFLKEHPEYSDKFQYSLSIYQEDSGNGGIMVSNYRLNKFQLECEYIWKVRGDVIEFSKL